MNIDLSGKTALATGSTAGIGYDIATALEAAANFVREHRPGSLLARFASVEEIANVVVFVASKEAAVTNGAAIRAEGGIVDTIA
jgi:NAD(P)-dependent dehydrogenase (short-subunit alcohol dehydrogenase family)